jgi:hypothetical protein
MTTLKYVICTACEEKYLKPQDGPCPFCEEPQPEWQEWDPQGEDVTHPDEVFGAVLGLLALLDDRGELHDREGRLYEAVAEALVIVSQMPAPRTDYFTTEGDPA